MLQLVFPDKCVSYETFIEDLSNSLVPKVVNALRMDNDIVSQREAYRKFGEGNVRRWISKGLLEPLSKRPGKIEYKLTDLVILQNRPQDYI